MLVSFTVASDRRSRVSGDIKMNRSVIAAPCSVAESQYRTDGWFVLRASLWVGC